MSASVDESGRDGEVGGATAVGEAMSRVGGSSVGSTTGARLPRPEFVMGCGEGLVGESDFSTILPLRAQGLRFVEIQFFQLFRLLIIQSDTVKLA